MVGVQVDGRGQTRDRLVPRLGLDREAPEKELRLGQPGLTLGQAQQRAPRAVVRLLLDLEPRQHQVGLLRVGAERDGALQLRFSLGVLALGTQKLGERHARVDLVRGQLDGAPGRAHRFVHVVDAHEQLGVLGPERGRVRVALEGGAHERGGVLEASGLDVHLRDGVGVVRVGLRVGGRRAARDLVVPCESGSAGDGASGQDRRHEERGQPGPGLRQEPPRRGREARVGNGARRLVDLAPGARLELHRPLDAGADRRRRLDLSGHEAQRADSAEAFAETAGELFTAQGQLVKPGRVVDRHGEAAFGEAPGLGAASRVGADHLRPGAANAMLEQAVPQIGHRAQDQIGDGAR